MLLIKEVQKFINSIRDLDKEHKKMQNRKINC